MAYTPTTWANGDTITAAGLNKMEQGIAAAESESILNLPINLITGALALGKTWQEIYNAVDAGKCWFINYPADAPVGYETAFVTAVMAADYGEGTKYYVYTSTVWYYADTASGYPVLGE